MTIKEISFRDFTRGYIPSNILILKDKKTKKSKGLYISPKYEKEVLNFLKEIENKKKEKRKKALLDFVGKFGDGEEFKDSKYTEIKAKKYE